MCGIAGMFNTKGITPADKQLLAKMSDRIKHRGPNGEGIYFDSHIGLAHRRLSIIDVSERGHQPMEYLDRYAIVFNGEIYNYIELQTFLVKKGYSFYSNSDTEVLLAAYDYYGVECVNHFNGMWAFLLYDRQNNELFISRDRFGVKPLYYYKTKDYFLFASEIKALLCDKRIERIANDRLVYDFLADSFLEHTNDTFYQNIYKVPASTYLLIDFNENTMDWSFKNYYDVNFTDVDSFMDFEKTRDKFKFLFEDSVEKRLRSDVPVGTCLSGGLDSSSIVTTVNKIYSTRNKEQHTFSFCPSDKKINERNYIKDVLKDKNIKAHYIFDNDFEIQRDFLKLVEAQEEPFRTMSMFAGYLVYKSARENGITVLLDGQGADEILCGYRKSRIYNLKKLVSEHHYITAIKEFLLSLSQIETTSSFKADFEKIKKIFNKNVEYKSIYLKEEFLSENKSGNIYGTGDFQNIDVKVISLPILLRYVDKNSMAVSVESRLPFLDYRFVDMCSHIPLSMKIKNGYSKYIMREALDLPDSVKYRKSKFGFNVPETMWIKKYESFFKSFFDLDHFKAGKYIDRERVLKDWNILVDGIDKNLLFRMISVVAWMDMFDVHSA